MSIEVNGVTLPDIPSEVLEQYPYAVITAMRATDAPDGTDAAYYLFSAEKPGYFVSADMTGDTRHYIAFFDSFMDNTYAMGVEGGFTFKDLNGNATGQTEWDILDPAKFTMDTCFLTTDTYEGDSGLAMDIVWANHDVIEATGVNEETGELLTGEIYFARNDSDPNYYAPKSWFDGMARQVMRLTGTSDKLNTTEMLAGLKALNSDSGGDTGGGSVTIVPWSTGTDEEIAAMVAAMDAGTLSIEDTGWAIGDERTVTLAAMAATGVGESHAEQTVTLVLMDSQHYTLTEATAGGDTKDHFVVGLKNCLNETGYMNSTGTNVGSWGGCARRTWCNEVFRTAIPETLRSCFKQFKVPTATEYNASTVTESDDYFALFAEKEVFGSKTHSNSSEATSLSQIEWYATAANRIKTSNGATCVWWERSPRSESSTAFCGVTTSAGADWYGPMNPKCISPFGCI